MCNCNRPSPLHSSNFSVFTVTMVFKQKQSLEVHLQTPVQTSCGENMFSGISLDIEGKSVIAWQIMYTIFIPF